MNIINTTLLKLALLPSGIYRKMGINTSHLKAILVTKLTMDDRRPNTFQQIQRKNDKPIRFATLLTMLWSAIMGFIFLTSFAFGKDYVTNFTIYFTFYVTILASILIADFTSVLIDVRDNYIILPKPVSDKTFVVSRLLHIFIHVCKLVIPMIIPGAVFITYKTGILGLIPFLLIVLLATLFTIFLINACYILILRITTPSRFKNIISYIQIIFAIIFYAGFQLAPRMVDSSVIKNYDISNKNGILLLPTYWFAGAWQQLHAWENSSRLWICLLLTVIVPIASIWTVIRFFAPSFNRKLAMISGSAGETENAVKKGNQTSASAYSNMLARFFTKRGAERKAFLFTWKMMLRSRDFKMKVYPGIGYMIVLLVILLLKNKEISVADIAAQTRQGIIYSLIFIYFSNILLVAALGQITMHEKFKAAWIFFTTPVEKPGNIISGSVKAAIAQFFFPLMLVITISLITIVGPGIIPNLLLGIANLLVITGLTAYISSNKLPFSSPQQNDAGSNFLRMFAVMILGTVLAIAHFFIYKITPVLYILAGLSFTAAWFILDAINRMNWKKVISRYND